MANAGVCRIFGPQRLGRRGAGASANRNDVQQADQSCAAHSATFLSDERIYMIEIEERSQNSSRQYL
jgi:hypothetical protein